MARKPMVSLTLAQDEGDDMEIPVYNRTVLAWERKFAGRSVAMLDPGQVKLTYLYELAFTALQAAGKFGGTFNDFCDEFDVMQATEIDESVDPTREVASTTSSPTLSASPESLPLNGVPSSGVMNGSLQPQ